MLARRVEWRVKSDGEQWRGGGRGVRLIGLDEARDTYLCPQSWNIEWLTGAAQLKLLIINADGRWSVKLFINECRLAASG